MILQIGKDPNWQAYLGVAIFLVGLAWSAMRWVGRTIRADIDTGLAGAPRKSLAMQAQTDLVPPALVKKALERGLVTAQQLSTMNPTERQFLFSTLRVQLEGTGEMPAAVPGARGSVATPVEVGALRNSQLRATTAMRTPPVGVRPVTPPGGARPSEAIRAISGAVFGMESMPASESLKVHCPSCGTLLVLPAFAPFVAHCAQCGFKTAVRQEEGGRMVLTVAPPMMGRRTEG